MHGGTIIQKDITPNRMELFHHKQMLITPKKFVVICSDISFQGE